MSKCLIWFSFLCLLFITLPAKTIEIRNPVFISYKQVLDYEINLEKRLKSQIDTYLRVRDTFVGVKIITRNFPVIKQNIKNLTPSVIQQALPGVPPSIFEQFNEMSPEGINGLPGMPIVPSLPGLPNVPLVNATKYADKNGIGGIIDEIEVDKEGRAKEPSKIVTKRKITIKTIEVNVNLSKYITDSKKSFIIQLIRKSGNLNRNDSVRVSYPNQRPLFSKKPIKKVNKNPSKKQVISDYKPNPSNIEQVNDNKCNISFSGGDLYGLKDMTLASLFQKCTSKEWLLYLLGFLLLILLIFRVTRRASNNKMIQTVTPSVAPQNQRPRLIDDLALMKILNSNSNPYSNDIMSRQSMSSSSNNFSYGRGNNRDRMANSPTSGLQNKMQNKVQQNNSIQDEEHRRVAQAIKRVEEQNLQFMTNMNRRIKKEINSAIAELKNEVDGERNSKDRSGIKSQKVNMEAGSNSAYKLELKKLTDEIQELKQTGVKTQEQELIQEVERKIVGKVEHLYDKQIKSLKKQVKKVLDNVHEKQMHINRSQAELLNKKRQYEQNNKQNNTTKLNNNIDDNLVSRISEEIAKNAKNEYQQTIDNLKNEFNRTIGSLSKRQENIEQKNHKTLNRIIDNLKVSNHDNATSSKITKPQDGATQADKEILYKLKVLEQANKDLGNKIDLHVQNNNTSSQFIAQVKQKINEISNQVQKSSHEVQQQFQQLNKLLQKSSARTENLEKSITNLEEDGKRIKNRIVDYLRAFRKKDNHNNKNGIKKLQDEFDSFISGIEIMKSNLQTESKNLQQQQNTIREKHKDIDRKLDDILKKNWNSKKDFIAEIEKISTINDDFKENNKQLITDVSNKLSELSQEIADIKKNQSSIKDKQFQIANNLQEEVEHKIQQLQKLDSITLELERKIKDLTVQNNIGHKVNSYNSNTADSNQYILQKSAQNEASENNFQKDKISKEYNESRLSEIANTDNHHDSHNDSNVLLSSTEDSNRFDKRIKLFENILENMEDQAAEKLMNNLKNNDPDLFSALNKMKIIRFHRLSDLNNQQLQQILGNVDLQDLNIALSGMPSSFFNRMANNLGERKSDFLKLNNQYLEVLEGEKYQARSAICKVAKMYIA